MRTRQVVVSLLSLSLCLRLSHSAAVVLFFFFPVFTSRPTGCPECCCVFAARRTSRTNLNIYGELHDSAAAVGSSPNKLTSTSRPQNHRATFLSISHRIDTNLYAVFLLIYNIIQVQSFSTIYSMHTQYIRVQT